MTFARAVGLLALLLLPAACGNAVHTKVEGAVGLTRAESGGLVVLVDTCSTTISKVSVSGGRESLRAEEKNPTYGELTPGSPQSGRLTLPVTDPPAGWTADRRIALPADPGALVIVVAGNTGADSQTQQASATVGQIAKLAPGQVLMGEGRPVSVDEFHRTACPQ